MSARRNGRWSWGLVAVALVELSFPVTAHDFWLQPTAFRLQPGQIAEITPMIGHGHDRQQWRGDPRRIIKLVSRSQAETTDHYPSSLPLRSGESIRVAYQEAGVHVLGLATDSARSELPAERFTKYLRAEGLDLLLADRGARGEEERPGREIYSRCAKLILEVTGAESRNGSIVRNLGLKLEIVPEGDPRKAGQATSVRVYYEGKPLAGALVKLRRLEADEGQYSAFTTDVGGRILVNGQSPGIWQLNVIWSKRLEQHVWAEFETTFSSLTFQVRAG